MMNEPSEEAARVYLDEAVNDLRTMADRDPRPREISSSRGFYLKVTDTQVILKVDISKETADG